MQCVDPCALSCGTGSECTVQNHVAICRCPRSTTGDPFRACRKFTRDEICAPCGQNTDCEVRTQDCTCPERLPVLEHVVLCLPKCQYGEIVFHGVQIALNTVNERESMYECRVHTLYIAGPSDSVLEFFNNL
jgi:hypothetical protein